MKIQKNNFKKMPIGACLAVSGALLVVGSVGVVYNPTLAITSDYSLDDNSITLDGEHDGSVAVALKTSVARSFTAIEGTWSLHEVVEPGATATSYLDLSGMKRDGTTDIEYGLSNGKGAWTSLSASDYMTVAANGEILSAIYTVDKNTPAGVYKISLSDGLLSYDEAGTEIDEDELNLDATVTVTRSEATGGETTTGDEATGGETTTGDETTGDEATTASGELAIPNTGTMTQNGSGANIAMISITAVASIAVSFMAILQIKSHKKVNFNKH